jgi:hypothetical protein
MCRSRRRTAFGTYQGASVIRKAFDWNLSRISMLEVEAGRLKCSEQATSFRMNIDEYQYDHKLNGECCCNMRSYCYALFELMYGLSWGWMDGWMLIMKQTCGRSYRYPLTSFPITPNSPYRAGHAPRTTPRLELCRSCLHIQPQVIDRQSIHVGMFFSIRAGSR